MGRKLHVAMHLLTGAWVNRTSRTHAGGPARLRTTGPALHLACSLLQRWPAGEKKGWGQSHSCLLQGRSTFQVAGMLGTRQGQGEGWESGRGFGWCQLNSGPRPCHLARWTPYSEERLCDPEVPQGCTPRVGVDLPSSQPQWRQRRPVSRGQHCGVAPPPARSTHGQPSTSATANALSWRCDCPSGPAPGYSWAAAVPWRLPPQAVAAGACCRFRRGRGTGLSS